MARPPKSQAAVATDARDALQVEALERHADAEQQKQTIANDLQNCYYYTAPRRVRSQTSQTTGQPSKPSDDRQLQTSFGFEVVDDYMSMLIETFTPREGPWAERAIPMRYDEDGEEDETIKEINEKIKIEDKRVFDLIRASNYYAEKAKAGVPDAAIGVVAMTITDPGAGRPIVCRGVPIRELEFDLGPDGRPDYRAVVRSTKYRYLKAELGKEIAAALPDEIAKKITDSKARQEPVEIIWAWWRNWENLGDIEWQHVVMVDRKVVHDAVIKGEGSCALIIGRFGATPDFAWPDGPLVKSLADLVTLDELRGALIENVDFTLRPPKAYDDDGVLNVPDDGIRPGDNLPKRPSYGKPVFEDIYTPRPIDAALFDVDHLQTRIRRLHYVDFPEQRGKTPPTATQWIDELAIRQRRIGTPGYAYWREEPYESFQRFRYLGEANGSVRAIDELKIPAGVSLQPYNPAERAQDSQDVSTAVRFAELGQTIAPTMWQVMVDEGKTLRNLQGKLRDEIVKLRDEGEVEDRIKTLTALGANLMGNKQGPQGGSPPAAGGA